MIEAELYQTYLASLLRGDKQACLDIVTKLLEAKIAIRQIYTDLFQKSMYSVGELWERNQISVAREHLATSITENMLSITYPHLFTGIESAKKAIVSCTANEYHQLGGRMVADIIEMHGWDAHFLGANTPVKDLLQFIDEIQPDFLGLSLAVYCNIPALKLTLEALQTHFKNLDILVGGHAFLWGGTGVLKKYPRTSYFESLAQLEANL